MNYAIQFEQILSPYLLISSRKRTVKHTLLYVNNGLVLVKLGKREYAVGQGQCYWIPADCLVSTTSSPQAQIFKVDFSVRLNDSFAQQAGYLPIQPIVQQAINRLSDPELTQEHQSILLQLVRYELRQLTPRTVESPLSKQVSGWEHVNDKGSALPEDVHTYLLLREARKRILSGSKKEKVARELFDMDTLRFDKLCQNLLGTQL